MQAKAAPAKWCWAWRTAAVSTCWSTCWVKPQDLFDEFAGKHKEHLGTGDVKYHMGFLPIWKPKAVWCTGAGV